MKPAKILLLICFTIAIIVKDTHSQVAAVKITVIVPAPDTSASGVFIAGSFNHWHANDSFYRMSRVADNIYTITIPVFDKTTYRYKYTHGTWDRVEVNGDDSNRVNRVFMSANGVSIIDTVVKWKQPKTATPNSLQLQRINAMKDSVLVRIQPGLQQMTELLKLYVANFLKDDPNRNFHNRLDKKAAKKIGNAYREITNLFWYVMNSLTKEQKLSIQKKLEGLAAKEDFINTFFGAFNSALEETYH